MTKKHYHVGSNTAGYVPEGDVFTTTNRQHANAISREDAKRALESEREGSSYLPKSDRPKWTLSGSNGQYWLDNDSPYHIGTSFWVHGPCECDDAEDFE